MEVDESGFIGSSKGTDNCFGGAVLELRLGLRPARYGVALRLAGAHGWAFLCYCVRCPGAGRRKNTRKMLGPPAAPAVFSVQLADCMRNG